MVANAFFRTTVFYHRVSDGIDRYGEGDGKAETVFPFAALVEWGGDKNKQNIDFQLNTNAAKITILAKDFEVAGLYVNGNLKVGGESDFITVNGKILKIVGIAPEAPLDNQNVLIVINAEMI